MDIAFIVFDVMSVVAFAISGALVAINKKMEIFGVIILGLTTAIGGGVIRDLILGITPPSSFQSVRDPLVAIATSIIVFIKPIREILSAEKNTHSIILLIADSIGLGLFTVIGVNSAMSAGYKDNIFLVIFLGVITGVGGGIIRDILAGEKPFILVKHFYATASLIGAIICTALYIYIGSVPSMIIGAVVIIALRICAAYFKWNLPRA